MSTKKHFAFGAALLSAVVALAQPVAAQEGVKLGENNTLTQKGTMLGAQTALAIGAGATAQNGVASIMAGKGVDLGKGNKITQTGTMLGAQTALAIGANAVAQNGVASIMAGR